MHTRHHFSRSRCLILILSHSLSLPNYIVYLPVFISITWSELSPESIWWLWCEELPPTLGVALTIWRGCNCSCKKGQHKLRIQDQVFAALRHYAWVKENVLDIKGWHGWFDEGNDITRRLNLRLLLLQLLLIVTWCHSGRGCTSEGTKNSKKQNKNMKCKK